MFATVYRERGYKPDHDESVMSDGIDYSMVDPHTLLDHATLEDWLFDGIPRMPYDKALALSTNKDINDADTFGDGDQTRWPLNSVAGQYLGYVWTHCDDLYEKLAVPVYDLHPFWHIHYACFLGDSIALQQLLHDGEKENIDKKHLLERRMSLLRLTALHCVVIGCKNKHAGSMISVKVATSGWRDFYRGVEHEFATCAEVLLAHGARVDARDVAGFTALAIATNCTDFGNDELMLVATVLGKYRANPNILPRFNATSLLVEPARSYEERQDPLSLGHIMLLLELGAATDTPTNCVHGEPSTTNSVIDLVSSMHVDLEDLVTSAAARKRVCGTQSLCAREVEFHGLQNQELNGVKGKVVGMDLMKGRYIVRFRKKTANKAGKRPCKKALVQAVHIHPIDGFVGQHVVVRQRSGVHWRHILGYCCNFNNKRNRFRVRLSPSACFDQHREVMVQANQMRLARRICGWSECSNERIKELRMCSCLTVAYCKSKDCQQRHWEDHKEDCVAMRETFRHFRVPITGMDMSSPLGNFCPTLPHNKVTVVRVDVSRVPMFSITIRNQDNSLVANYRGREGGSLRKLGEFVLGLRDYLQVGQTASAGFFHAIILASSRDVVMSPSILQPRPW